MPQVMNLSHVWVSYVFLCVYDRCRFLSHECHAFCFAAGFTQTVVTQASIVVGASLLAVCLTFFAAPGFVNIRRLLENRAPHWFTPCLRHPASYRSPGVECWGGNMCPYSLTEYIQYVPLLRAGVRLVTGISVSVLSLACLASDVGRAAGG